MGVQQSLETFVVKCGCGIHPLSLTLPNNDLPFLLDTIGRTVVELADGSAISPPLKCRACGGVLTLCRYDFGGYVVVREKLMKLFPDYASVSLEIKEMERSALRVGLSPQDFSAAVRSVLKELRQKTTERASIEDLRKAGVRSLVIVEDDAHGGNVKKVFLD